MVAPSVIAAEAPYNGITFLALVEELLNCFGITNSSYASTDANMTAASATQVAQAKTCVLRALVYLQEVRSNWWPMSEDDATAASPYTRVLLPTDFASFGKGGAWIAGVRLDLLNTEQYAANVRSDADGGGIVCAEVAGPPTHARLVMIQNTETSVVYYRWALDVFPRQTEAWTAHVLYKATAKAITTDIVVRVPTRLHSCLSDRARAEWLKMRDNLKGAAACLELVEKDLADIDETPGEQMVMVAKSAKPSETAPRFVG